MTRADQGPRPWIPAGAASPGSVSHHRPAEGGGFRGFGALAAMAMVLALTACAGSALPPTTSDARENAATMAACRQRAEQVYDIRHRDAIYAMQSGANSPYSASYVPGVPERGLSQLYEQDTMVSDCVRNTGVEGDRTPDQAPAPQPNPVARP